MTGTITVEDGELIQPGDHAVVTVDLGRDVAIDTGLDFAVREGNRTVGAGTIASVLD